MKREIIYGDLSYRVNGILFLTHNELGRYRNEKQYGDFLEQRFQENRISYEREKILSISFPEEKIGRNKIDFLIENKIVLEIKAKPFLEKLDYYQTKRYLESSGKRLAILVNFRQKHLALKRVLHGYTA